MDLDFYRETHEKEFRRKDTLAQRASTIIATLTTLCGALGFVVVNHKPTDGQGELVFWPLAGASAIALGTCAFFLVKSYLVPPLNDIAKPTEWLKYWQELLVKYKNKQGGFASAEEEFADHLIQLYADVADGNIEANDTRGSRLVISNYALLSAFALLVVTLLAFYYGNYVFPTKGVDQMFTTKDALLCIPASRVIEQNVDPGKRPVPDPAPPPFQSSGK